MNNLHLKGYKTFKDIHLELSSINILIGANGSGKSNFNIINSVAYYGQELLGNYYCTIYELD